MNCFHIEIVDTQDTQEMYIIYFVKEFFNIYRNGFGFK